MTERLQPRHLRSYNEPAFFLVHGDSVKAENNKDVSILIIDDEENIRDGSERILLRMGCIVHKASCGAEGIDILSSHEIQIVLLDLKMPGMDGMEVLAHINKLNSNILVVILSGYATLDTVINAMKQGAYDFIPKPFEPAQLRTSVTSAIEDIRLNIQRS